MNICICGKEITPELLRRRQAATADFTRVNPNYCSIKCMVRTPIKPTKAESERPTAESIRKVLMDAKNNKS